ncbi:D-alanyl-D-alanine carboxypeptidase family protein [Terricaulis sp.]|uniref:D-alanyl-D-alanine carboxypeptidase family protein n=1 Tax=Terricaulis sp. TaxID=2768686 RepID=UPI0037847DD6
MKSAGQSLKILAGLGVAIALAFASPASAQSSDRYAAYVIDARTNEVLLDDQADEGRYPASLTKMMTLYMLFEALERGDVTMSTRLTASRNAARQPPSRLGLRRGDVITVEQAINALVVQSANDVAVLVAERLGGSEARFSAAMTTRARELGMTNSRFVNASGLPDTRQRSSAHDMAMLAQALWRDFPEHYHYFQTPSFSWRRGGGRNHNHLLGQVEGVDGIKTGYTRASGFNLASSAERGGRRVIVVVMGGETAAARDAQVAYLIEGAFEEFARREQPGATRFVGLQSPRLDVQLAPNALASNQPPRPLPPSPYQVYQGMVVETLSPVRAPIESSPTAQGDESTEEEQSTEE